MREIKTLFICIAIPVVSAAMHSPRSEGGHSKSVECGTRCATKNDETHQHHQSRRYSWEHSRHRLRLRPTWSRGWQSFLSPLQPLLSSFYDMLPRSFVWRPSNKAKTSNRKTPSFGSPYLPQWGLLVNKGSISLFIRSSHYTLF